MKVTATGKGSNAGIYAASGDIQLLGAEVTANAEAANCIHAGTGNLTIEGGKVTATSTATDGNGLYADGEISISWSDAENDYITATSYNGNVVVAGGQRFQAINSDYTIAFLSGSLNKDDDNDAELIASLAGTTLKPYVTTGYVVTAVGLTAGENPDYTNGGDTKFYVYEEGATVTVGCTVGEGHIVEVIGLPDGIAFNDDRQFAMPAQDITLTYSALDVDKFALANNSVDYNNTALAPDITYDGDDFDAGNYTLLYKKDESASAAEAKYPGNYLVTLTGKKAYFGTVVIDGEFVINPSSNFATTLFAENTTNQWMTWCGTEELVTPENVKVYNVSGANNGKATLSDITGEARFGNVTMTLIPAYTPVVLYRETVDEAVAGMFNATGTVPTSGYDSETGIVTTTGAGCTYYGTTTAKATIPNDNFANERTYILYDDKFIKADTNSGIAANRCWLVIDGASSIRQLGIVIGDETTGISNNELYELHELSADGAWYDLQGRKYNSKPTKKGIYIYNGKKTVVK